MKRIFLSVLAFSLFAEGFTQNFASFRTSSIRFRGVLSSDTENVKREADPGFTAKLIQKKFDFKKQSAPTMRLSSMPNGIEILKEAAKELAAQEHKFVLLSGHKYMVNNCLGLKVSAGEFYVKFKNPFVGDDPLGFKLKLEVDKISFNVIKIRTKPRSPDFSDPNPCHFSGKFEIKGEAKDLTMTAYVDPIVSGNAQTLCLLGWYDAPKLDWRMNALNFLDFANSLDAVGKDMIYDGLDFGMQNLLMDKFIDLMRSAMKKYYEVCDDVYWTARELFWNSGVDGRTTYDVVYGAVGNEKTTGANNERSSGQWEITPLASMKGVLGKLNTSFPEDVEWSIDVRSATENKFITNRSSGSRHGPSYNIAPGTYNFRLNTIMVENVPVERGKETRLKAGVLSIVSDGNWEIYSESKGKFHTSGNKPKKIALPVGNYQLKLGGQFFPVAIKDKETVEY